MIFGNVVELTLIAPGFEIAMLVTYGRREAWRWDAAFEKFVVLFECNKRRVWSVPANGYKERLIVTVFGKLLNIVERALGHRPVIVMNGGLAKSGILQGWAFGPTRFVEFAIIDQGGARPIDADITDAACLITMELIGANEMHAADEGRVVSGSTQCMG